MAKIKNSEKGQAIVEMTVSLIAIMAVFLGVIFAFALGKINVENIIECRGMADSYAGNGVIGTSGYGMPIATWEAGGDDRMFTNDDQSVIIDGDNSQIFMDELRNGSIDLVSGFNENYVHNNFAQGMNEMFSLFLGMANMTSYNVVTDPYEIETIENLRGAFSSIIYNSDITVKNTVYMPIFDYVEE